MPIELQEAALECVSALNAHSNGEFMSENGSHAPLPEPIREAKKWFTDTIQAAIEERSPVIAGTDIEICETDGNNSNTDIHIDWHIPNGFSKFVLTLCSASQASTIFFPESREQDFRRAPSTNEWFERNENGLLVPARGRDMPTYFQAQNGQIAVFRAQQDLHGAAPLPAGAKKILFNHKRNLII
jgi:hypothetical protein